MYRKIATVVVTALVLATASSAAVSKPHSAPQSISAAEQAWFGPASNPTNGR
jgi:hypothetical protein